MKEGALEYLTSQVTKKTAFAENKKLEMTEKNLDNL